LMFLFKPMGKTR